jgi:mannosyltransferase OCH1-like enzyme
MESIVVLVLLIVLLVTAGAVVTAGAPTFEFFKVERIPKVIIQTWKDTEIPEKYLPLMNTLRIMNPDFTFLFFTDTDIDDFIKEKYPEYYSTYLRLPIKIQRIDLFRYLAVYHFGGFYFDLDMLSENPLDDNLLTFSGSVWPVDQDLFRNGCTSLRQSYCDNGVKFLLGQYAFGAHKKDAFLKILIDHIHDNIDDYVEGNDHTHHYVYKTTGPLFVTDLYLKFKDEINVNILHDVGQRFGGYARHLYMGTWK